MKKILKYIILVIICAVLIYTIKSMYQETKIKKGNASDNIVNELQIERQSAQNNKTSENNTELQNRNDKTENLNLVEENYKGYAVAANLKIKKLNIDTCVLDDYTKEAMETCVTKFFGPEPNEIGNFCITGHNYITKNMFGYLYKLEVGDTFILTDNKNGKVQYKIYDKYRVKPNETYRIITKNKWEKGGYISNLLQLYR